MECLKQFNFFIDAPSSFTVANGTYSPWTVGTNINFVVNSFLKNTDFKVQGFKNINLYGVKLMAGLNCPGLGNHALLSDWNFQVAITGQNPTIGGEFITNTWPASTNITNFRLGKYNNEIMFPDPIKSTTNVGINFFQAQGNNAESALGLNLDIVLQLIFYYKFEGEEQDLLF